jgi:NTE family protein
MVLERIVHYMNLSKMDTEKGKPIFDIIACTSIGAINSAVLVSYVVENETYEGLAERLVDFWNYLSKESIVETNPFFKPWWDYWHTINREVASGEAARRYYSAKEFAIFGVPSVFYPHGPTHDNKFFDSDSFKSENKIPWQIHKTWTISGHSRRKIPDR